MELIIKISEEAYERHKAYRDTFKLSEAIANGVPLPKGHGRLLDANALIANLEKDTREAFTKHQVWLMFSEYNEDVPAIVEADKENDNGNSNQE